MYFSVTREGLPVFFQRKPFAGVFYMLGLWEFARATGDDACRAEALEMFDNLGRWIARPELLGRAAGGSAAVQQPGQLHGAG